MARMEGPRARWLTLSPAIPATVRGQLALNEEVYCQMCGLCPGDIDEFTERVAEFYADWVPDNGLSFRSRFSEVRYLCSTCNQGAKNITPEKPTTIWLLSQVRRAGLHEQKAVFEWLSNKFGR
jgi:hypothetical protein